MTTRLRLFQKTAFFINIILSIYIMLEVVLQLSFLVAQTPLQYFISQKATQWLIVKPQIGYVSATFLGQTKGFVVQCSELSIPSLEANEPFIEQMNLHLLFSWQGTLLQTNCSDGHIYLLQNAQNKKLYEVFRFTKNNKDTAQKNEKRTLPEMLTFENVRFTQINKAKKNTIRLHLQRINLRLLTQLPTIAAEAIGTLKVIQFSFNRFAPKNDFLREQQVQLYLNIQYVPQVNYILITTQQLEINKVDCEANMRINMDTTRAYELEARTHNISLFQGLKMLPDRIQRLFKGYEAEGFFDVYLNIEGNLKPDNSPRIRANFTCQKNTLVYVPLKDTLKNLQIEGFFANYQLSQPKNIAKVGSAYSSLVIEKATADYQAEKLQIQFFINNFKDPFVHVACKGRINMAHFFAIYPSPSIKEIKGTADVEVFYDGRLKDLTENPYNPAMRIKGVIKTNAIAATFKELVLPFTKISGVFSFDKKNVQVTNLTFYIGKSHFNCYGTFENFSSFLLGGQTLTLNASFFSKYIDIDEILALNNEKEIIKTVLGLWQKKIPPYYLSISELLNLRMKGTIMRCKFGELISKDIHTRLSITEKTLHIDSLSMKTLEGLVFLTMKIKTDKEEHSKVDLDVDIKKINLVHFFKVMDNFGQDLLKEKNVEGKIDANIKFKADFDRQLNMQVNTVEAKVDMLLQDLVLKGFFPLQKISKRLFPHRDLNLIKIKRLENHLTISKNKVILPETTLASSILFFTIKGEYEMNKALDVHLKIPLNNFESPYVLEKVQESALKAISLHATLMGEMHRLKTSYRLAPFQENFHKKRKKSK